MKRINKYLLVLLVIAAVAALTALFLLTPDDGEVVTTVTDAGDGRCARVSGMTTAFIDESGDSETLGYVDARKLARGPDGRLYAAYRKKADGSDDLQIFVSVSGDGRSWSLANSGRAISEGTGYDQRVPSILWRGDTLHVAWYGADRESADDTDQHEIKYGSSSDGGATFSPWRNIGVVEGYDDEEEWQEHPVINGGPDEDDPLYIVWEGKDSDHHNQQIKFSRSADGGGSWSEPVNVQSTPGRSQSRPTVLVNGEELILFAYGSQVVNDEDGNDNDNGNGNNGNIGIIMTHSRDGGSSWEPWTLLSDPATDSRHVSAVMDSRGNLHIAYRRFDGDQSRIVYGFSSDGAQWQWTDAPATEESQFFPSLSVLGPQESILLGWSEQSGKAKAPRETLSDDATGTIARVGVDNEIVIEETFPGFWMTLPARSETAEFLFISDGKESSLCFAGRGQGGG